MGTFAIGPVLKTLAILGAVAVLGLNFVLLADFFGLSTLIFAG